MNGDTTSTSAALRLVSIEEHEQGYKDHTLEFRSGEKLDVRIWGLPAERSAKLARACFGGAGQPFDLVVAESLIDPDTLTPDKLAAKLAEVVRFRKRLVPGDWGLLCDFCVALTWGESFKKKLTQLAQEVEKLEATLTTLPSTSPEPALPASAPDSPPPTSAAGASPS